MSNFLGQNGLGDLKKKLMNTEYLQEVVNDPGSK